MAYIMLAPLLPLFASSGGDVSGIIISIVTFLGVCALINKQHKTAFERKKRKTSQAESLVVAALAIYFGCAFYFRWYESRKVTAIAGRFGVSTKMFVGMLAVLLSCASVWSMRWLLYDGKKIFSETKYLSELNRRLEQTDRGAVKLDRNDWLMCALLALADAIMFCDTCPLFKIRLDVDSAYYLYLGQEMLRGRIPYVDFFDHKGTLMHFIECAGAWLSFPGTYAGIWLIELTSLFITAIFLYKTIRLLTDAKNVSYLVLSVMMLTYTGMYSQGGNLTETYALPCIAMAVYIYLEFFTTAQYRPMEIAALGAGCAAVAFLRVNMVGVWIAFTPLVLFFLLKGRQYKKLIQCSLYFTGGFAAVCILMGVYYLLTGSINGMIADYILYNMQYTESKGSLANKIQAALVLMQGFCFVPIVLAFLLYKQGGFSHKARKLFWLNMWGFAVSLLLASMSGRRYIHYGMVLIPLFVVPVWLIIQSVVDYWRQTTAEGENTNISVFGKDPKRTIAVTVCLTVFLISVPKVLTTVSAKADPVVEYLAKETEESDDVLIIGNTCYYYLESERRTNNKFVCYYPSATSDTLYDEFIAEVNDHPSDVVLFSVKYEKMEAFFDQLCEEGKYTYEDHGSFGVYRLQGA